MERFNNYNRVMEKHHPRNNTERRVIEDGIRSLDVLLPVLQETVKRMGWGVQKGGKCSRAGGPGPKPIGWVRTSEDVFQYTSLLDRSASRWRQLDAGQTQPETRRTSGDVLQWGRMECEGQEPDQSKKKSNNERGDPLTAGNENEVNADCLAGGPLAPGLNCNAMVET